MRCQWPRWRAVILKNGRSGWLRGFEIRLLAIDYRKFRNLGAKK
jgi:hypothetical protein